MFNDIIESEMTDETVFLKVSRELIDELYAIHGPDSLKDLGNFAAQVIEKAAMAQVAEKVFNDKMYYENLSKKIFKK